MTVIQTSIDKMGSDPADGHCGTPLLIASLPRTPLFSLIHVSLQYNVMSMESRSMPISKCGSRGGMRTPPRIIPSVAELFTFAVARIRRSTGRKRLHETVGRVARPITPSSFGLTRPLSWRHRHFDFPALPNYACRLWSNALARPSVAGSLLVWEFGRTPHLDQRCIPHRSRTKIPQLFNILDSDFDRADNSLNIPPRLHTRSLCEIHHTVSVADTSPER